eukprot:gb/GECG01010593.1/.p1 GENE.gb/GECG01010593.1/~~gb/GECG01010593.1/.p1  ORF type:complete len:615 (+),score=54.32 gb/GECG01010593.1/:1-1845(+)
MKISGWITGAALLLAVILEARADETTHVYEKGEPVTLWLCKVGPYHNPQEAYLFYTLPYCAPPEELQPRNRFAGLGELLEGTELVNSDLKINFRENRDHTPYCSMTLDEDSAQQFHYAVLNHYWYQVFVDELPVWGLVGENVGEPLQDKKKAREHMMQPHEEHGNKVNYLYTHKSLSISYNDNRIVEVNLTTDEPVEIKTGKTFDLSYSVKWVPTKKPFETRFQRYLDQNFFEHQIHWFSIFNAFMMVVFLCGGVALILVRTLKKDLARYMQEDEDLESFDKAVSYATGEDSGWKQVHGDVFRRPPAFELLASLVGAGAQLVLMVLIVIVASLAGSLYVDRGAIGTAVIVGYSLTSGAAGFVSGAFYRAQHSASSDRNWVRVMFLTAALLPGILFFTLFSLNLVALYYNTVNTMRAALMISLFLLWLFVSLPLVIFGTLAGRRYGGTIRTPCRVNAIPRPLPVKKSLFTNNWVLIFSGGILPFGSIFIEMYYIFTSFWNYKFYYVYGFMLLVYLILVAVTCCVSVMSTYLQLNAEDWRWPWTSFLSGSSTGFYVFMYSVYYFLFKTRMSGFLQTAFYFGYMGLFSVILSILTGTVSYLAARSFVFKIFSSVKVD